MTNLPEVDTITTTVYLVGDTPEEAKHSLPFDDFDSANEYRRDNGYKNVYAVEAVIDVSDHTTMEVVS